MKFYSYILFIEKLKKAGVTAFKIEGRNKETEYVDTVTRVYIKALDKKLTEREIKAGIKELKKVYNKGFSSGFFLRTPTSDDISKIEHSSATQSKKFIGKITHYYSKLGVASLKLNAGSLKIGDEIFIMGKTTGLVRCKIKSMEIRKRAVGRVRKGQEVAIKVPLCRKGDEVYLIVGKK